MMYKHTHFVGIQRMDVSLYLTFRNKCYTTGLVCHKWDTKPPSSFEWVVCGLFYYPFISPTLLIQATIRSRAIRVLATAHAATARVQG